MLQPHIKVEHVEPFCILSGNPDRIPIIAAYLKDAEKIVEHRGLVAYKAFTPNLGIPVSILTTGMGTGSSGIVLEEAFKAGARSLFRVGSTGSLIDDPNMGIGSLFIPFGAIQEEGTSRIIIPMEVPAVAHPKLFQALVQSAENLNIQYSSGLVWTTDIYYHPNPDHFKKWVRYGANCVEMESSMMFRFCASKNFEVKSATILTSDGNLNENTSIYMGDLSKNNELFKLGVGNSIKITIQAIESLN